MSQRKRQDEVLFCERCGISFLWSNEEQQIQAADVATDGPVRAPSHCPGCRILLPTSGRERGVVKWYNARKHYGFIARRNTTEIYVHATALEDSQRLNVGDLVEFGIGQNERGALAEDVRILERAPRLLS